MRFETSSNDIIKMVAESEGDYLLLALLAQKDVRIASYSNCDGKTEELNLQFFEKDVKRDKNERN